MIVAQMCTDDDRVELALLADEHARQPRLLEHFVDSLDLDAPVMIQHVVEEAQYQHHAAVLSPQESILLPDGLSGGGVEDVAHDEAIAPHLREAAGPGEQAHPIFRVELLVAHHDGVEGHAVHQGLQHLARQSLEKAAVAEVAVVHQEQVFLLLRTALLQVLVETHYVRQRRISIAVQRRLVRKRHPRVDVREHQHIDGCQLKLLKRVGASDAAEPEEQESRRAHPEASLPKRLPGPGKSLTPNESHQYGRQVLLQMPLSFGCCGGGSAERSCPKRPLLSCVCARAGLPAAQTGVGLGRSVGRGLGAAGRKWKIVGVPARIPGACGGAAVAFSPLYGPHSLQPAAARRNLRVSDPGMPWYRALELFRTDATAALGSRGGCMG
eukprot:scaffold889_cov268-Pinguiococcus_pyrenoidosus.AAC.11